MLGSFVHFFSNVDKLVELARNSEFRKFLANPKVQELLKDESFREAVQSNNMAQLAAHQDFLGLIQDPEIRALLENLKKSVEG